MPPKRGKGIALDAITSASEIIDSAAPGARQNMSVIPSMRVPWLLGPPTSPSSSLHVHASDRLNRGVAAKVNESIDGGVACD